MEEIELLSGVETTLIDKMGSDSIICNAARVSANNHELFVPEEVLSGKDRGLIRYLMKHRHGTPFEHNGFILFVKSPIFVFREFQRHRVWSYNEMSGRYVEMLPEFYIPGPERPLIEQGKIGNYSFVQGTEEQYEITVELHKHSFQTAWESYQGMLRVGIAREVARNVLPLSTYSQMYATCNMRALMSFLSLRTRDDRATYPSGPLYEIELVAKQLEDFLAEYFPVTYEAFNDFGRVSP